MLESQLNNSRVENFNFLDFFFVDLAEVIMPLSHLDIQNVVGQVPNACETVVEFLFENVQTLGVFFTALSAKLRHLARSSA